MSVSTFGPHGLAIAWAAATPLVKFSFQVDAISFRVFRDIDELRAHGLFTTLGGEKHLALLQDERSQASSAN